MASKMNMAECNKTLEYIMRQKKTLEYIYRTGLYKKDEQAYNLAVKDHMEHGVNLGVGISKSKIFDIDYDIIHLLTLTDNKYDPKRHSLPFDVIFVDAKIPIIGSTGTIKKTNINYHGFLLFNVYEDEGIRFEYPWYSKNNAEVISIRMLSVWSHSDTPGGFMRLCLSDEREDVKPDAISFKIETFEQKQIKSFALNFLDFINDPEVEFVYSRANRKRNERRVKRGLPAYPKIASIRIKNKLKRYITKMKKNSKMFYSHRFWVRGHWRTLRNEKRYGENTGKTVWIKPYVKGDGLLINKKYELREHFGGVVGG
jgi:hypothetical protein